MAHSGFRMQCKPWLLRFLVAMRSVLSSLHALGGNQVPETGLEPALVSQPDPKSGASTNSATPAYLKMNELRGVQAVQC